IGAEPSQRDYADDEGDCIRIHRAKAFRNAADFGLRRDSATAGRDRRLWRRQLFRSQSHPGHRAQDGVGRHAARSDALGPRAWIAARVYRRLRGAARRRGHRDVTAQPAVRRRTNRSPLTGRGRAYSSMYINAGLLSTRATRVGVESSGFAQELVTSVERYVSWIGLQFDVRRTDSSPRASLIKPFGNPMRE